MLARVLDIALCLSVRLSVCHNFTSRCSVEADERTGLAFGVGTSFYQFYTVLKGNSGISRNKGTSLWNFIPNTGHRKILR